MPDLLVQSAPVQNADGIEQQRLSGSMPGMPDRTVGVVMMSCRDVDVAEYDDYESVFDRLHELIQEYKEETGIDLYFETSKGEYNGSTD